MGEIAELFFCSYLSKNLLTKIMILIQCNQLPVEANWLKHRVIPNFLTRVPDKTSIKFHASILAQVCNWNYTLRSKVLVLFSYPPHLESYYLPPSYCLGFCVGSFKSFIDSSCEWILKWKTLSACVSEHTVNLWRNLTLFVQIWVAIQL